MMQEIKNNNSNIRLDVFLVNHFSTISRNKIQKLIISGNIKVDSFVVKPSFILKNKECITIYSLELDKPEKYIKENIPLDIIYEDDSIVVINKQSGLVVHPGAGNLSGTLLNGLLFHFKKLSNVDFSRPGIVHRLDKDTSGIILIAKTDEAHFNLGEQFANRKVEKVYRAIVWGNIPESGIIEGYIGRNPKYRTLFKLNNSKGKYSFTKYKKISYCSPFSYIELYPSTGRTHQIRVHLSHIGHSILLDESYGGGKNKIKSFHQKNNLKINKIFKMIERFALHAYQITIKHPINKKNITFTAPMPNDMKNVLTLFNE